MVETTTEATAAKIAQATQIINYFQRLNDSAKILIKEYFGICLVFIMQVFLSFFESMTRRRSGSTIMTLTTYPKLS